MKYRVIKMFTDLKDNNYEYNIGDFYPRQGYEPEKERIAELSGSRNRQGTPLIEPIEEAAENAAEDIEEDKPKKRTRHKTDEE